MQRAQHGAKSDAAPSAEPKQSSPNEPESSPLAFALATSPGSSRAAPGGAPPPSGGGGSGGAARILVDDGPPLAIGQVRREGFVAEVTAAIEEAVEEELSGSDFSAEDCPYLQHWLAYYRDKPAEQIERVIQRYAQPKEWSALGLRAAVLERVRGAARTWIATGGRELQLPPGIEPLDSSDGVPRASEAGVIQRKSIEGRAGATRGDPSAALARLGAGQPLDAGVQSRMESGFGTTLSGVRIHTDATAAQVARSLDARAFTIGRDVAFAHGQYRPGSLAGDALLAHELAHTVQQRGASRFASSTVEEPIGEREADHAAAAVVRGLHGARDAEVEPLERRLTRFGSLRLNRCPVDEDGALPRVESAFEESEELAEETDEAADAIQATTAQPIVEPGVDDLSSWTWTPAPKEEVLTLIGPAPGGQGSAAFLLPAHLAILQSAESVTATSSGGKARAPQLGALMRLTASGHSGQNLVHTGKGTGFLVDVGGTRTGGTSIVQADNLQLLAQRFGIQRITGGLLTHTHADHLANLTTLVQQGVIQGNAIYVYPGWENARSGPIGKVLQELGSGQFASRGFAQGWTPNSLSTRIQAGPVAGQSVTRSSLAVGDARFETVTDTNQLRAFNQALQAGDWKKATKHADAASMLTRLSSVHGGVSVLITEDIRGRDFERLHKHMGEPAFREFVSGARVLKGLHHLGAVGSEADVRGLRLLLRHMGVARHQITVVAQNEGPGDTNRALVEALRASGVRVVAAGPAEGGAGSQVSISATGKVHGQGVRDWSADQKVVAVRDRIEKLERASAAVTASPDYRGGGSSAASDVVKGLQQEAQRLERLIVERMELSTGQLHRSTSDAQSAQKLAANATAMARVDGMERQLGPAEVQRLAGQATTAQEVKRRMDLARTRGRVSPQLRALIASVDPVIAKQLMLDKLGKPMSRNQLRKAMRQLQTQLKRQLKRELLAGSSGGRTGGRGFAWFGLAMEVLNLARPFIDQMANDRADQDWKDFYLFYRDLTWWQEKGLRPPYILKADDKELQGAAEVELAISRRIYDDSEKARKGKKGPQISAALKNATPADRLYIPRIDNWSTEVARGFWDALMLWTSTHIRNFNDFASEFEEGLPAPIRMVAVQEKVEFTKRDWEMRVGKEDADGHVVEHWQQSDDLTRIMRATVRALIKGTEEDIETEWSERDEPIVEHKSWNSPDSRGPAGFRPTGLATFKAAPPVYAEVDGKAQQLTAFRFWNDKPRFMAFEHNKKEKRGIPSPKGYAWVKGYDYTTAAAIRLGDTWNLVGDFKIPKEPKTLDVNSPDFMRDWKPEEYMDETQLAAWHIHTKSTPGFQTKYTKYGSGSYRGAVRIWEKGPNDSGLLLIRVSDWNKLGS